jgi:GT2 family glycosyltransferase
MPPRVSVVVPVFNDPGNLAECLSALAAGRDGDTEIVVVDDASTDDTPRVAEGFGVRLVRLDTNRGPGGARNAGARVARGDVLFFVDADVVVAPDALDRVRAAFAADSALAAVFGSYDERPRAAGLVSQYRNLLHHWVHQQASPEASTFWAGCGAVRRPVFEAMGGFDERRFPTSSIEDIELGYRLRRAGYRIRLDKALQGTHLKRWRFPSVVWTDITRRAIPWARLILETRHAPNDLNVSRSQRLSAALVLLAGALLLAAAFRPAAAALAALPLAAVVVLNHRLFAFFARSRGWAFAVACVPLHWLYFLYSGASYAFVWLETLLRQPPATSRSLPRG